MNLRVRDTGLTELMDDPACDPDRLRRTLRRFGRVNRLVSCWGAVYRTHLRPELENLGRPARLLDIGCGAGDVLRRIVRLAGADGFEIEALGIDADPRAIEVAHALEPMRGLRFRQATSSTIVTEGASFDIVISNHLMHHLDDEALGIVLDDSAVLASRLGLHSDIARSRAAYVAFALGITPLAPGSFLRIDGLRSIRRSFTYAELAARLPLDWHVERPGAFRLLAVHRRTS